jgi:hypothetical protein
LGSRVELTIRSRDLEGEGQAAIEAYAGAAAGGEAGLIPSLNFGKSRDGINPHRYDTWHPPNQHV